MRKEEAWWQEPTRGQWMAFFAEGKLKKISVQGGPPITLCDAPFPQGGSWGEDGTIVAALDACSGLSRIPAAGGAPQPLTRLVNGETTHRTPQILPGGQSVLFTASTTITNFENAAIQVLSLKTGQVKTLLQGYGGLYVSGHIMYIRQGVLFGVRFNPARLEVTGTPVPLLDDVFVDSSACGCADLDVSQTGTLVYYTSKAAAAALAYPVVWLDRSGQTHPLLTKPRNYWMPRLSPEGRRLAVSVYDGGKGSDLYVYDIERETFSRLTFNGLNRYPVWTPGGTHLVWDSTTEKAIRWIRADGAGEAQRLLEGKDVLVPWSFSPDGRYLSYGELTNGTDLDLWILPVDASDPEHLKPGTPEVFLKTPAAEWGARFSRDGRWISYASDESGRDEVYVRPFHRAAGGRRQISTNGGTFSYWSPDGRALYYLAADRRIMVAEYTATGESFSAGTPRVWSETPVRNVGLREYETTLDLAPDGTRFAVFPSEAADQKGSAHAIFLLNFLDELQRRLP